MMKDPTAACTRDYTTDPAFTLPSLNLLCTLGFRVEEFGSSGSPGSYLSMKPLSYIPQREAREEITPRKKLSKNIFLWKFPRDRPDPMEE
jgi:hypothetical protein